MKHCLNCFGILILVLSVLPSCSDSSKLQSEIDDLKLRVTNLEQANTNSRSYQELIEKVNGQQTQITDLEKEQSKLINELNNLKQQAASQDEIDALQQKIDEIKQEIDKILSESNCVISSIVPVKQGDEVIGYTIMFKDGDSFTIYTSCESVPRLYPKLGEDGIYYWTINGEWLYHEGKPLPCAKNYVYIGKSSDGWFIEYYVGENPIVGTPHYQHIPEKTVSTTPIMNVRIAGPYAYLTVANGFELKVRVEGRYFEPLDIETSVLPGQRYSYEWPLGFNMDGRYYTNVELPSPTGVYAANAYFVDTTEITYGTDDELFRVGARVYDGFGPAEQDYMGFSLKTNNDMPEHFMVVIELYYAEDEHHPNWVLVQRENVCFKQATVGNAPNYVLFSSAGEKTSNGFYINTDLQVELSILEGNEWIEEVQMKTKSLYARQEFTVNVLENTSTEPRFGLIGYRASKGDQIIKYVTILQAGTRPNIEFEDPNTEAACVATFDKDGDGKVSYEEAFSDGYLYTTYDWDDNVHPAQNNITGNTKIKNFNELKFFPVLMCFPEAFKGCSSLESVQFPKSFPEEIQYGLFSGCTSLQSINLPSHLKKIGSSAFEGSGIEKIDIPEKVVCESAAFKNCKSLVDINYHLTDSFAESLFEGCENLWKNDEYPWIRADFIGDRAFYGVKFSNAKSLHITTNHIGARSFANTSAGHIQWQFEKGATLDYGSFSGCSETRRFEVFGVNSAKAPEIKPNSFDVKMEELRVPTYSDIEDYSDKGWGEHFNIISYNYM